MFLIVLPDLPTEDRLLRQVRAGSEDAVIGVYRAFFTPLFHYVRLRVGDGKLAEDIVSDVFVRLIEALGTRTAPRDNLRGWLFQVARNEVSRHYGKVKQLPLADLDEWLPAPASTNPEAQVMDTFDIERTQHALRMLKAEQQEVLILRFGQTLSLRETADVMGKSTSAIKSLQFRALDTLRQILTGEASHG
jgi:RNA polymerase sigma-70 factor (ECF subfamily)